jgi:hypothetical protein
LIIGLSAACLGLSLVTFLTLLIDGALEGRTFPDLARKSTLYLTLASTGLCAAFLLSRFFRSEDLCIKSDEQENPVLLAAQVCGILFLPFTRLVLQLCVFVLTNLSFIGYGKIFFYSCNFLFYHSILSVFQD